MRKKILIGGIIVLAAGVWWLWFIGGKVPTSNPADSKINANLVLGGGSRLSGPTDQLSLLVQQAISQKNGPLIIPPAAQIAAPINQPLGPLTIIRSETKATPQKYGEAMVSALRPYLESNTENLAKVLLRYLNQGGNQSDLAILQQSARGIAITLDNLRTVAVPASVSEAHQRFLDHLAKQGELANYMSQVVSEPVRAIQSGQQYVPEYLLTTKALLDINQYFIAHGVRFDASTTPKIRINF